MGDDENVPGAETRSGKLAVPWPDVCAAAALALAVTDADAEQILYATPTFADLHAASPAEIEGRPVTVLDAPESRGELTAHIHSRADQLARAGQPGGASSTVGFIARRARLDGSTFPARVEARPVNGHDDTPRFWVITVDELSETGEDPDAQARLAAIVESSDDAIIGKTLNGTITSWNEGAERILGYTAGEILGRSILTVIPPELRYEEPRILSRIAQGERVASFETERMRKDGNRFYASLTVSPIKTRTGEVVGASKILRDVTHRREREAAERLLAAASERLARSFDIPAMLTDLANLLVESFADGCIITRMDREIPADAEDASFTHVAVATRTPGADVALREVMTRYPLPPRATTGHPFVVRTGCAQRFPGPMTSRLAASAVTNDPQGITVLRRAIGFDVCSALVVPLVAGDHVLGALTLLRYTVPPAAPDLPHAAPRVEQRQFSEFDLHTAEELGRRAGLAIEHAELYWGASQANRAKTHFLATMSHELRTPLNAIGGYVQLLEMGIFGAVAPEQSEALARIEASQRHLLGLINGVLNYSRLEAGAVAFRSAPVRVAEVVAACEALVTPQARARGLELASATCHDDHDLVALGDHEKVQQIVLNLLSNAVKFTAAGGNIELRCAGDDAGSVTIIVSDTGRGIPAEDLERIFQPFVQIDAALTREQEGTGLGLAISRDLARGMGGDLTATSTLGVGSTFTLTLPRA